MKTKEFMEQKVSEMSVDELISAIKIKLREQEQPKEEKHSLSDKVIVYKGIQSPFYYEDVVKEALKEFIDDIINMPFRKMNVEAIMKKAKFRFGERLI